MRANRARSRFREERREDLPKVGGKAPPHDLAAERASLSAAILDRGAAEMVAGLLKVEDFFDMTNARIFQALSDLISNGHPADAIAVAGWLTDREWHVEGGWFAKVSELADAAPAVANADKYARIVSLKARRRRMIADCQRFGAEGYFDVGDEEEWLDRVEATVSQHAHPPDRKDAKGIQEILKTVFETITTNAANGQRIDGIPTGYDRLDSKIAGLHDGDLTIVAARPGMGKTSFVLNVATNVASPRTITAPGPGEAGHGVERYEPGFGVCVFSLEMPREQLATRMVCSEGRVDLGKLRQGHLHADDWRKLTESGGYLSTLPIWIDDTPAIGVLELRAKVRRQQAEFDREAVAATATTPARPARRVGVVIVDYLQLMTGDADSREQEISAISRGLKALAKELKVPVLALSQLNRAVETRGKDKRPQLSDLRESGAIEQDADNIIFIYRDDYYHEDSDAKGIAELIIAKQRNGPTGKVKVRFSASCTRFDNLEPGDYPESADE